MEWQINADSEPVLDGWGWDDYWGPTDWIKWHGLVKKKYGKDEANRRLIKWYHEASLGASNYDWRTFDTQFKNYAKLNGFYDGLFTGIAAVIMKPVSATTTVVDSASNIVSNTASGAEKTSKILKWALPAAGIILFSAGTYYVYNRVKN